MSPFDVNRPPSFWPDYTVTKQQKSAADAEAPLFTRHPRNPILARKDWPYPINSVFNAGAVRPLTAIRCCSAALKIGAVCRIFVPHAPRMASRLAHRCRANIDGKSSRFSRGNMGY